MKLRRALLATGAVLAVAVVTACSGGTSAGAGQAPEGVGTIGVIFPFSHVAWTDFEEGIRAAGEAQGIEFKVNNSNNDPAKEAQLVTDLVTARVDAILIAPVNGDASLTGPVARAGQQGVPVFGFSGCSDTDVSREHLMACISSNDFELGSLVGESLAEYAAGRTLRVGELNCDKFEPCRSRHDGFMAGLGSTPIELVDSQEGYLLDAAAPVASAMLTAHPDLDVILAQNEDGIVAAHNAVQARGLAGQVAVFGVGMDPRIAPLTLSGDGIIRYSSGQDTAEMGRIALQAILDSAAGRPVEFAQFSPSTPFPADDRAAAQQYLDDHQS